MRLSFVIVPFLRSDGSDVCKLTGLIINAIDSDRSIPPLTLLLLSLSVVLTSTTLAFEVLTIPDFIDWLFWKVCSIESMLLTARGFAAVVRVGYFWAAFEGRDAL